MATFSNDDMFVSVMPRILDPSMKFTKESLINSNKPVTTEPKPVKSKPVENKSIISEYKYYIIIIISILIFLVIIYFIYKYYDNKKSIILDQTSDIKYEQPVVRKPDNSKDDIKSYLSSYISDDKSECSELSEDNDEISEDNSNEEINEKKIKFESFIKEVSFDNNSKLKMELDPIKEIIESDPIKEIIESKTDDDDEEFDYGSLHKEEEFSDTESIIDISKSDDDGLSIFKKYVNN